MFNHYDNETRLIAILRCVVDDTADAAMLRQLGPARTREEIFVSRALGKKPWAAIPPRTTLEMWLAFIAEDTAEPAPGSYTVRSCAESCIITYARRVKGATAIVPIFPPHSPYEIALAKLAGIIPVSYGVQGRPWELLINQLAEQGPRKNATVIYGSVPTNEGGVISHLQDLTGGPPSLTRTCPIFPGLTLIRDDGSILRVYDGMLDADSGELVAITDVFDITDRTSFGGSSATKVYTRLNNMARLADYQGHLVSSMLPIASGSNAEVDAVSVTGYIKDTTYLGENWIYILAPAGRFDTVTDFTTWIHDHPFQVCYPLATPLTIQLTPNELRHALGCTKYLGVGAWKLRPGVATVITAQLTTSEATTHYDLAPSEAEGWTFEISVDGQTVTGATGALSVAAGDHSVIITATPAVGAATCYIHPTLYSEEATP